MSGVYIGDYIYGAYINFVMGSEGGGGEINPSAQTGDFLMTIIFAIITLILLGATALLFIAKFKKNDQFANSVSKVGVVAKSMASKKIMIASIVVAAVIAIVSASFSAKAFADVNYENPSAPAYSLATGTMDKSTGTITVPTITINDEAVKQTEQYAVIQALSIKGLDQFSSKYLGNWNVKIDDCLVYSGNANVLRKCPFITRESGVLKIDISATDVPSEIMDALNGNIGVLLELGSGGPGFITVEKDAKPVATVDLVNQNSVWGTEEFKVVPGKEEAFAKLMNDNGWEKESDTSYKKELDFYTDYNGILSIWNEAIVNGLLVNEHQFYKWRPARNDMTNLLLADETFYPEWFPEEKPVTFKYVLGTGVKLTPHGQTVLQQKGWVLKEDDPELGADEGDKYIEGKATNLTDFSEINKVLSAECFVFENAYFNGWGFPEGKIFEVCGTEDYIKNEAQISPITVLLSGMVVDETGKGMPNVCVAFKPLGGNNASRFEARKQNVKSTYTTITDANGNYWLPVDKGLTGIMYYGLTIFDNTDNDWSGKSLLLENVQAQNIPTIVVREKVKLYYQKQVETDLSNKQILDYGAIKFINSKGEVFYQSQSDKEGFIEVCANDSGKLIYESALYYCEVDIDNTSSASTVENPVILTIKAKDPKTESDCLIKGVAYLWTSLDTKVPLANAKLKFILKDTVNTDQLYVEVDTDENGEYSFKAFQGCIIDLVQCEAQGLSWRDEEPPTITGDVFLYDVNFVAPED